jgi:FtsH-binding integral membrane protein
LRIAGAIGLGSVVVYVAVVAGQEDRASVPQAVFWVVVILGAGALAWFAERSSAHGRRMAMSAATMFFVVSVFSSGVFVAVYLTATVLTVLGFLRIPKEDADNGN